MTKNEVIALILAIIVGVSVAFFVGRVSVADDGKLLAAYARCKETGGQWSEGSDYYRCRAPGEIVGVGR